RQLKTRPDFAGVQVGYTGTYLVSIETVAQIKREMALVSAVVGLVLVLILVVYFRRFSGAVLVGLPLLLGQVWTGGLLYLMWGHVNVLTAFSFSILAGLGSDYGIYLLARFYQERDLGTPFETACYRAFRITGKANSMAAVTTIASFAALLFSGFKVFLEFGAVGCIGLLLNYVAMMCLMPALLSIAERHPKNSILTWLFGRSGRRPTSPVSAPEWMKRLLRPTAPRAVLLVAGLLVGLSLLVLPQQ